MKTLEEWRAVISREKGSVGKKPYSHNIIGLALGGIAKEYGIPAANKAIRDFKLKKLGWSEADGS